MSSFTDTYVVPLDEEAENGNGYFAVGKQFSYDVGYLGSGWTITVREGYRTDFASVPKLLKIFFPVTGRISIPSVLHDYLLDQGYPRWIADLVFLDAMHAKKMGPWAYTIAWLSVRTQKGTKEFKTNDFPKKPLP